MVFLYPYFPPSVGAEAERESPGIPLGQAEQFLLTIHSIQGQSRKESNMDTAEANRIRNKRDSRK